MIISKDIRNALIIFAVALVLRLTYALICQKYYFFYGHPGSDVTYYQQWAMDIVGGHGDGKPFMGLPLYPYFLSVLMGLTFKNLALIRFIHLVLGAANAALVYVIGRKVFGGRVAWTAGLLTAGNFILIHFDWLMMPVPLLIFLALVIVVCLVHPQVLTRPRDWGLLGFLTGLGAVGDGKFLIFGAVFMLYRFMLAREQRAVIVSRVIVPFMVGLMLLPLAVTARNKIVGGEWVFISGQSGLSFYVGNNPDASGVFENPEFIRPTHGGQDEDQKIFAEAVLKKQLTAGEVGGFWKAKAGEFIFRDPVGYARLLGQKFLIFLRQTERADEIDLILQRDWRTWLDFNPFFVLCPLAVLGMAVSLRRRLGAELVLMVASQLAVTIIFFMTTRHRVTIMPFLLLFEVYGVFWLWEKIRGPQSRVARAAVIGLLMYWMFLPPESLDAPTLNFLRAVKTGPVYEQRSDYKAAQAEYLKALALRPGDTNSYYNLGNAYLLDQNLPLAEESYQKALAVCHYNVDARFNLGAVYEQTGRPELALKAYQGVQEYQSDSPDVFLRIAQLYQRLGDCSQAQVYFQKLIALRPALAKEVSSLFAQCRANPSP